MRVTISIMSLSMFLTKVASVTAPYELKGAEREGNWMADSLRIKTETLQCRWLLIGKSLAEHNQIF